MARPGPKPHTDLEKMRRGTGKATPAALAELAREPGDVPVMYDGLSEQAQELWQQNIEFFVANGCRRADTMYLNQSIMAAAQWETQARAYQSGEMEEPPPVTLLVELRTRLSELGLAGPRSRVGLKAQTPENPTGNPFRSNGVRARG